MKRATIFFTIALLLLSALVFPTSAYYEPYVNPEISVTLNNGDSPTVDGKIGYNEYGSSPTLSYANASDKPQFTPYDDHDQFDNWDFDFYATADNNFLYLAWTVNSFVFQPFDRNVVEPDWRYTSDDSYLGNMWKFSNVQFIITRGAPKSGVTDYDKNCLEIGFCQLEDGSVGKYAYRIPDGYTKSSLSLNNWKASVVNDGYMTTTYEIAIPWWATGVNYVEDGTQFGLAFSVSAQYDYNVQKGMIEWSDSVLKPRDTDNAGVVTLVSSNDIPEGSAPIESYRAIRFDIDKVNEYHTGEDVVLQTNPYHPINSNWSYALLLEPIDGSETVYRLIAKQQGIGYEILFDKYKEGMLVLGIHSDGSAEYGTEFYEGYAEKQAAIDLPLGSELTLWGVDIYAGKKIYSNAMIYVSEYAIDDEITVYPDYSSDDITPDKSNTSKAPEKNNDDDRVALPEVNSGSTLPSVLVAIIAVIVALIICCLPFVIILVVIIIIISVNRKKKNQAKEEFKAANTDNPDNTNKQ